MAAQRTGASTFALPTTSILNSLGAKEGIVKRIYLIILCFAISGCNGFSKATPTSTVTSTPKLTAIFTLTPTITATATSRPTRTPTPIPWQSYKMTYSIRIGGVGKLWMPIPRDWDGIGMTNVSLIEITPQPDDTYQDSQGNMIAFWNLGYSNGNADFSITFKVDLAPIYYGINPEQIGEYDKTSLNYQHYTQPSSWIESDNVEIIQLAKNIIGNETNPYEQANLIHKWVSNNIKSGSLETALSTLEKRSAECAGHSFLFVALLRSLGIPARVVSGLHTAYQGTFTNGSFWEHTLYNHVWSEFYLPGYGWIQSDTSAGEQNFAEINDPRLILSRGEVELGHNYSFIVVPFFHIPHVEFIGNGDPNTQNAGESLILTVDKIP